MIKSKFLFFITLILASCASKSVIITSKNEAIKNNTYTTEFSKPTTVEGEKEASVAIENKINTTENFIEKEVVAEILSDTVAIDSISHTTKISETIVLNEQDSEEYTEDLNYNATLADKILSNALNNIGSRYRTGGTTKSGFDCSGLMIASFAGSGVKLPRTSNDMSRFGKKISSKRAQKGDLIFFKTLGNKRINHVGVVLEVLDDEIKFVHSSIHRGVIISSTKDGYYKKTFAQINRVLE